LICLSGETVQLSLHILLVEALLEFVFEICFGISFFFICSE